MNDADFDPTSYEKECLRLVQAATQHLGVMPHGDRVTSVALRNIYPDTEIVVSLEKDDGTEGLLPFPLYSGLFQTQLGNMPPAAEVAGLIMVNLEEP